MRNLIIYSDNDSFAGCENIVSVLLNDIGFAKQFNTTFSVHPNYILPNSQTD